jgi:predicted nucleic acid-binding protein
MILVDTSVIVAWIDTTHKHHKECWRAIRYWAGRDRLAVSAVTYGELAAGGRLREAVDEDLLGFERIDLDAASAWRAGRAFRQYRPQKSESAVLPDFFIRAQAAVLNMPHLTNDRRRLVHWPDVDFLFPNASPS